MVSNMLHSRSTNIVRTILFLHMIGLLVTSIVAIVDGTKIITTNTINVRQSTIVSHRQLVEDTRLSYDEIMEKNNIQVLTHDRDNNSNTVLLPLPICDLQCLNGGSCSYVSTNIQILQEEFQKGSMIQYCTCPINYTGMSCEIQKVENINTPDDCLVEQSISDFAYSMCLHTYTEYCTSHLDTTISKLNYCTNGGKCVNWIESAKSVPYNPQLITDSDNNNGCICPPEFYGAHCELVRLGYKKQQHSDTTLIQDKTYYNWTKRNDSSLTTGNDKIDELLHVGRYYVDSSYINSPSSDLNNNNNINSNAIDNTTVNTITTKTNLGNNINEQQQIMSNATRINLSTGILFGTVVGIIIVVLGILYILLRWKQQKINTQHDDEHPMKKKKNNNNNSSQCCMNPFRIQYRVMTHIPPPTNGLKQNSLQHHDSRRGTTGSSAYEAIHQLNSYDIFENNTIDRSRHDDYCINNNNNNNNHNDIEARSNHVTISSNHVNDIVLSSSNFYNANNDNYYYTNSRLVLNEEESIGSSGGDARRGGSSSCSGSERTRSVLDQLESFYTDESLLPSSLSLSKNCTTILSCVEIDNDIVSVVKSKCNVEDNNNNNNNRLALPEVTTVHSIDDMSLQYNNDIDQRSDRSRERSSTQHWKILSKSFMFNDNEEVS